MNSYFISMCTVLLSLSKIFLLYIYFGLEFETESLIQYANGQYECGMCGKGFPLKITCRRHVQNVHSNNQKVLCHVCNKYMKNSGTLKAHLRGRHGIYQGGKSK